MKKFTVFFTLFTCTLLAINNVYSQSLPTPIAAYNFEDDASDEMGNYDGTLVNDAEIVNDVQRGGNVLSLIDSGYVTIPIELAAELDNFSFTAWVKYGGDVPWAGLMGLGMFAKNVAPYWDFHIQGPEGEGRGKLSFYASAVEVWPGDGTAQTVVDYVLPIEEWTHLALTFELGTGGAVYADGELLTLEPWNSSNDHDVSPSILGAEIFTIGRDAFNQGILTNTKIDNFRFYNKTITENEVTAIYQASDDLNSAGKNIFYDNNEFKILSNLSQSETIIKFYIPENRHVRLSVFNVMGQEVDVIVDGYKNAGNHSISYYSSSLKNGVYLIRFTSNGQSTTKRILVRNFE